MFKPLPKPVLTKEQETRSMVAFYDNLDAIRAAIKEYDAAVAHAKEAEASALEATKNADIKAQEVAQKEVAVDNLIKANIEALQKANAEIKKAAEAQADYAVKAQAQKAWEEQAANYEADYAAKADSLTQAAFALNKRQVEVDAREKTLQTKLDSFKSV